MIYSKKNWQKRDGGDGAPAALEDIIYRIWFILYIWYDDIFDDICYSWGYNI